MEGALYKCKLCKCLYPYEEMSDEHYPARSVGNEDIVALDLVKLMSIDIRDEIVLRRKKGENIEKITDDIFDTKLSKTMYPNGRTARTLCKKMQYFFGKI